MAFSAAGELVGGFLGCCEGLGWEVPERSHVLCLVCLCHLQQRGSPSPPARVTSGQQSPLNLALGLYIPIVVLICMPATDCDRALHYKLLTKKKQKSEYLVIIGSSVLLFAVGAGHCHHHSIST
jgi:hypothetical protein